MIGEAGISVGIAKDSGFFRACLCIGEVLKQEGILSCLDGENNV